MNIFESFLAAKLFRLSMPMQNFQPDFNRIWMVSSVNRSIPADQKSDIVMYSGCFMVGANTSLSPFSISFSLRNGLRKASLSQFAYHDGRPEIRIRAFLSVLDFLESTGELPLGTVAEHKARISGPSRSRQEACDGYHDFCQRAAKDLPYELSLEALRLAA
ncbi:hypothetical protein AB3X96_18070 [Paraburkholderia sp. BR13439]|uniref:hypothetical protein n=1 Tax=Paraburkholderia sp. BR13439 TaxID=3236996 RepID=UPI0034CEE8AE